MAIDPEAIRSWLHEALLGIVSDGAPADISVTQTDTRTYQFDATTNATDASWISQQREDVRRALRTVVAVIATRQSLSLGLRFLVAAPANAALPLAGDPPTVLASRGATMKLTDDPKATSSKTRPSNTSRGPKISRKASRSKTPNARTKPTGARRAAASSRRSRSRPR